MSGTFVRQVAADKHYSVQLVTGINIHDEERYAYLLLRESSVPILQAALLQGNANLRKLGIVLASGDGHVPPPDVEQEVNHIFSQVGHA